MFLFLLSSEMIDIAIWVCGSSDVSCTCKVYCLIAAVHQCHLYCEYIISIVISMEHSFKMFTMLIMLTC